jgi:hypothetical protein
VGAATPRGAVEISIASQNQAGLRICPVRPIEHGDIRQHTIRRDFKDRAVMKRAAGTGHAIEQTIIAHDQTCRWIGLV